MKKKLIRNPASMFVKRPMYYRMDGTPYLGKNATEEWCKDFEKRGERTIARTDLPWGGFVSTVWMGLDHSFLSDGPPLIFESMVFGDDEQDMDRYSTREQALLGHQRLVMKWQKRPHETTK